jgi:hypothetical protein
MEPVVLGGQIAATSRVDVAARVTKLARQLS